MQGKDGQLQQYVSEINEKDRKLRQMEQNWEGSQRGMREWEVKWNNLSMDMQKLMSQKNLDEARLRDSMGIQLS